MAIIVEFLSEAGEKVEDYNHEVFDEEEIKSIMKLELYSIVSLGKGDKKQSYRVIKINHNYQSGKLTGKDEDVMRYVFTVEAA